MVRNEEANAQGLQSCYQRNALALDATEPWREQGFLLSWWRSDARKLRPALRHGIAYELCHA